MPMAMPGRSRKLLLCSVGMAVVLLFFLYHPANQLPPPPLPPMPGTYQYFTEVDFHYRTKQFGAISHCDPRFAPSQALAIPETRRTLTALLRSFAATMETLHVESWIAHGALLGWHWNQRLLPWDTDLDVQMMAESVGYLATYFNLTEYQHVVEGESIPRTYLLDINPHHSISSSRDVANKIDGRWIDKTNGKYIDITAVHSRPTPEAAMESNGEILFCKDGHQYKKEDLFPLQETSLEGIRVKVPRDAAKVLQEEYGKTSTSNTRFHWHRFNQATKTWEPE